MIEDKTIGIVLVAVVGFLGTVFTGMMTYFMRRSDQRAEAKKLEVQLVADRLAASDKINELKLQNIANVVDATHTLSNSKMGNALRINKIVTKRLAELSKDPADMEIAKEAELQYNEHQKQQAKVDKKFPEGIPPASDASML